MTMGKNARLRKSEVVAESAVYRLDEQVGFLLRRATQRHVAIFAGRMGADLTPTQWAALSKLYEEGPTSQNLLGRNTAMDAATIKGVVDRLTARELMETRGDPADGRRRVVALTRAGERLVEGLLAQAATVSEETLAPLTQPEQAQLAALLRKLA
jgi:DNA-binding MarR family transcriptional regulator